MAHWRLRHKEEARAWYDLAITWLAKNFERFLEAKGRRKGQAGYLEYFDFNNDGRINATDRAAFPKIKQPE